MWAKKKKQQTSITIEIFKLDKTFRDHSLKAMTDFRLHYIRGTLSKVTLEWGKENISVSSICLVPLLGSLVQYWTCLMGTSFREKWQSHVGVVRLLFYSCHGISGGCVFRGKNGECTARVPPFLWRCFFPFFSRLQLQVFFPEQV